MKVSLYTFLFDDNNKYYVYNSLTNALLELQDDLYYKLVDAENNNSEVDLLGEEQDTVDYLKFNRVITDNDTDEFLIYKSNILAQRAEKDFMHLTLSPTMECCFKCHYCFETVKTAGKMTAEVMDNIIKHISNYKDLKSLKITWFGGEPLLAVNEMVLFYSKLEPLLKSLNYSSNIITTGYHISEKIIGVLKQIKVTSMQITLDGNKESHNKIKFLEECDDCFSKVLDNIDLATKLYPELHVIIRVNITLDNCKQFPELYSYLLNRYQGANVAVAPAFVLDRNGGCSSSVSDNSVSNLFSPKDYAKYILQLAKKGIDSTYIRYPGKFFQECAVRNNIAISFDARGNAYKCWEVIGNEKYSIGKVNKEGYLENVDVTNLNRQLFGADPLFDKKCSRCKYLPLCCGGCPIQRIQNEFENGKNICCTYYKSHIKEFMIEHIRRKSNN